MAQAVPFCAGGAKSRFCSHRSPGLPQLPTAPSNASARPCGYPSAVAVGRNRMASPLGGGATKMALSDFFGVAAALGGLRPPPPSPGQWKTQKNSKQQSTCRRRRVRATGGLLGVMKVTPCDCGPNFCGVAATGCQKPPPPSPGEKIDLTTLKQQSTDGLKRAGALRASQGSIKQPITPSFSFSPGGDPGGVF